MGGMGLRASCQGQDIFTPVGVCVWGGGWQAAQVRVS